MSDPAPQPAVPAAHDVTAPLTVHHLNNSRSQRILWLLEELGVPYALRKYQRTPLLLAPPELLQISPLGKSPVITDGALTLAESGAIVEYILRKYAPARAPLAGAAWRDDLYFTHYAEGSLQPLVVQRLLYQRFPLRAPAPARAAIAPFFAELDAAFVEPALARHGALIEAHLATAGDFFAGGAEPTAADYMMSFALETLLARAPQHVGPATRAYVARIQARPAYKRAIEKGGEYAYNYSE